MSVPSQFRGGTLGRSRLTQRDELGEVMVPRFLRTVAERIGVTKGLAERKELTMSESIVINDSRLKNYWAFKNKNSNDYVHRSHQANFYYCVTKDRPDNTMTFLLMPAGKDEEYTWYFVFTADPKANPCWTIGTDKKDKLQDGKFNGSDSQRFAFIKVDGQRYNIFCKGSGMYLYKSKKLMDAHQPIRQSDDPSGKDRFEFEFDKLGEVTIPTPETPEKDPGQLDDPPKPADYGDLPEFPHEVLVGATLLPFFNVPKDPTAIGPNPINWQITHRPYYIYNRYQQWQYSNNGWINQAEPTQQKFTVTYTEGIEKSQGKQVQEKTSFTIGVDLGTKASLGLEGIGIEASRGFKFQWQKELTVTVCENQTTWSEVTNTYELTFEDASQGVTYIDWQIYDIWQIVYDKRNRESWDVGTNLRRPEWWPDTAVPTKAS